MQYSIVNYSELDNIAFRIDAEFYHPLFIKFQKFLEKFGFSSIIKIGGKLDCSAFYPSITDYYNFEKQGAPFLRVNELQNGLLKITDNTAFLPESILEEYKSNIAIAYPNDILIAKGGNTLAKVGLLTDQYKKYSVSRDLIILRTNKLKEINVYYLWLFLHSKLGQNLMLRTASQTGQPHLTVNSINHLSIPKISHKLQNLFEEIFKSSVRLQNSSKSLYAEAENFLLSELGLETWKPQHKLSYVKNFSDTVGTERIDAEYFQPKYDEILEKIRECKSGFDTLAKIAKIKDKNFNPENEETYKYIELSNISGNGEITGFTEALGAELPSRARRKVKSGDVIVSSIEGSLESVALVHYELENALCSTGFFVIDSKEINSETLLCFLKTIAGQLQLKKGCKGTILTAISKTELERVLIPKIKPEIQKQIKEKIIEMYRSKQESKDLLEKAKKAVEIAIEENESEALKFLDRK